MSRCRRKKSGSSNSSATVWLALFEESVAVLTHSSLEGCCCWPLGDCCDVGGPIDCASSMMFLCLPVMTALLRPGCGRGL